MDASVAGELVPDRARLSDILACVTAAFDNAPATPRYVVSTAPIAFEDVLVPFVETGRDMIRADLQDHALLLSDDAWITLDRALLALLSRIALQTLCSEFALSQGLTGWTPWRKADGSYRAFVAQVRTNGMRDILAAYPVLARLLATTIANWASGHGEMVRRLQADWPCLRATFALQTPCRVDSIAPYRSDLHDSGRAVIILEFSGRLLVYKPRPLTMERAFNDVLAWANAAGFAHPFWRTMLVTRHDYGWMDYAIPYPCADCAGIARFYHRVGGLICLTSLLQATDIHYENLMASGDQPIVVDAETLLHPRWGDNLADRLQDSGWFPLRAGPDFSALGADDAVPTSYPAATSLDTNSDRMIFAYAPFRAPARHNIPTMNGRRETAASHEASIVAGYCEMYRLIVCEKASLLNLVAGFGNQPGRFIARSSNSYGLLLQAALAPDPLRSEAARCDVFRTLADDARDPLIFAAEMQALTRMDVPRLSTGDPALSVLWPSPVAQTIARITGASECDLDIHVTLLCEHLAQVKSSSDPEFCHG